MWINLLVDVSVLTLLLLLLLLLCDVVAGVGATAAERAEATRHFPPLPRPIARAVLDAVRRTDAMMIDSNRRLTLFVYGFLIRLRRLRVKGNNSVVVSSTYAVTVTVAVNLQPQGMCITRQVRLGNGVCGRVVD